MSRRKNWRHYHLEQDGNVLNSMEQRYSRAWALVARLAKQAPESAWRVVECRSGQCHAVDRHARPYRYEQPITGNGQLQMPKSRET